MPTETEELRLVITLTDNASAGLRLVRQEMAQVGGGAAQAHVERFKRGHAELAKQIKELQELATGGEKAMLGFIGKFGVAGAAITAFGTVVIAGLHGLNEFSNKITELNNKAKVFGVHPAVLKSIEEQLDRIGIGADQADANVARFNEAYANIGRAGSKEHLELLDMAGKHRDEMEAGIQSILKEQDPILAMNKAAAQAQVVFNERMKDTNNNLADSTEFTKKFLEKWGLDAIMRGVQMKPVGEEERARIDAQAAATKEFYTGVKDLKKEWNDWMDEMSTSALSPDGVVVTGLHLAISLTKTLHELWEKPLTKQVAKGTFDTMSFMIPGVNTVKFWKWITDLYQSSGKDEKGLGDQLGLDSLPKAKDGEADGEAKATHLLSSMADDNEEYKNTMKDNTGQLKRLNDYLAAQQLGINVPPGDGGGVATPGGGAAPASAGPGPSTGPPSTAGPSTGPSSAAPSPAAAPSSGMGNLGAPEFDAFTKGAKSMGAIGANTPEAAAAAMAGGGTTTATTPATQKSNEDVLAETAKWVRDKESFTPRNEPDFGQRKIGYGTDPKGRTSITEPEARKEEEDYLAGSLKRINDMNPNLSRGQKIALASLDFNTGWTQRGGEKNEALRAAIKAGDVGAARKLFGTYTHVGGPKGRELPGLVTRRQEELSIFDTPDKKSESEKGSIAGDRATVDKKSIKVVKVDATGKVAVNIGADKGDDVTLGSKRLFKPTAPERSTQMVPAETGPKASTFAETAD